MALSVTTEADAMPDLGVVALISGQALAHPSHPAVRYRDREYSYAELEARSNALAAALQARGVGTGDRVAVCLEPELDVPAVLLAIFKAGAAYVPLDAQYPPARVAEILADVRPRVIVTRAPLRDRLALRGAAMLLLDVDAEWIASQSSAALSVAFDADRPATIFFTSGTTGRPKGAIATHRQLSFYARSARQRLEHAPSDVIPTIARFSFSISIFELLVPLTAGATVLVLDRDDVMDTARMATALERVTFFHMGPSLLRGVLAEIAARGDAATRYANVRHASSGGDMVPAQFLERMRALFPNAGVYVLYGCSEISCMGTCYELPRSGPVERTYVGAPFPEMAVLLLDEAGREVSRGDVGEVYFAGPGVIPGYLDRPELDAERFIEHSGLRYYRTGDLGRWHEGSGLELLGRADFQIKVRGMRVESAEVEYHLRQVPGVRDAAVALRTRRGEEVLAAFVVRDAAVAEDPAQPLALKIRRALVERVPDFMVPSAIVELPALPLNHNLKLDRRALPELAVEVESGEHAFPPRTARERWMAAIWTELLGRESVGRRDNFFELGGDSLLGLQLILRVERECGVRIEAIDVLRESLGTLAGIVASALNEPSLGDVAAGGGESATVSRRESFYFGPQQSLYGILEMPAGSVRLAVLICGPLGGEDVRPGFVTSLLMRRLAERGVATMRFDWYGTRDSAGDGPDGNPARWREDLLAAEAELRARSGATRVVAIGLRLGALVLASALPAMQLERALLWDAVEDGDAYVRWAERLERARFLRSMARLHFAGGRRSRGVTELLGFCWANTTLDSLRQMRLDALLADCRTPVHRVSAADSRLWSDPYKLLDQIPEAGIVTALANAMELA